MNTISGPAVPIFGGKNNVATGRYIYIFAPTQPPHTARSRLGRAWDAWRLWWDEDRIMAALIGYTAASWAVGCTLLLTAAATK